MKTHYFSYIALLLSSITLTACMGEDRSDEQPFAPTVELVGIHTDGPTAFMEGHVKESPNSSLLECGFHFGNDTMLVGILSDTDDHFFAETDSLEAGTYFAVAYARNGIGTSYSDTLRFEIE